jgi:hypothetical protein
MPPSLPEAVLRAERAAAAFTVRQAQMRAERLALSVRSGRLGSVAWRAEQSRLRAEHDERADRADRGAKKPSV